MADVSELAAWLRLEQVQGLGILQQVPGDDFKLTAMPLSFHGVRANIAGRAPTLGEHNASFD